MNEVVVDGEVIGKGEEIFVLELDNEFLCVFYTATRHGRIQKAWQSAEFVEYDAQSRARFQYGVLKERGKWEMADQNGIREQGRR